MNIFLTKKNIDQLATETTLFNYSPILIAIDTKGNPVEILGPSQVINKEIVSSKIATLNQQIIQLNTELNLANEIIASIDSHINADAVAVENTNDTNIVL